MKKYIKDYVSEFEKELNVSLMNKEHDRPLVEYVMDAWKSLEIVKNIQIRKFEYDDIESHIDINNHIFKRDKKKRKKERYNYKFINDDRYGKLTVYIRITLEEEDPKTKEKTVHQKDFTKQMLIPLQDEDGYYYIKGKKYYIIYQLLDKSTYTSSSSVTLKSLMPICVSRHGLKAETFVKSMKKVVDNAVDSGLIKDDESTAKDISGNEFLLPHYNVFVFKKEVPLILFYIANGLDWALAYLGVDNIIAFKDNVDNINTEKNLYFQISSKCYIEINKELFLKYPYIQGIVGMFLHVTTNRTSVADLYDKEIWIKKLSNNNTIEKGQDILVFFTRLMDETTRKILMLDNFNKRDAYAILRWIMENFNELRMKDNLSIYNKRLRCNEHIASLLTKEFSKRLNKIITLGAKASMSDFQDMFKFSGSILLQKMHSSGINLMCHFNNLSNCGKSHKDYIY